MSTKYGYIGYGPDTSPVIVAKQVFSPTGVQTNFTFAAGYQIGYLDVYLNGARQIEGQDFSATDTSTVGLTTAAQSGDVLELVAYKAYNLAAPSAVGNFNVFGNLNVTGNESVSTLVATTAIGIGSTLTTSSTLPYPVTISAPGSTPTPSLSYCIADISSNQNGYSQFNLRNTNTGYNASGDLVITTDNGTDTTNFIDLGINNTGFNTSTWTVNGALDGYLYSSNTNFSVGVAFTNRYLSFFAGGTLAANEKMRMTDTGVGIGTTNTSNTLQVGTAITMYGSTGIISATKYYGDGSNLSGIDATRIVSGLSSVTVASSSTISAYVNGSNIFNVTGTGVTMTSGKRLDVSSYSENVNFLGSVSGTTALDVGTYSVFVADISGSTSVTFTLTGAVSGRLSSATLILRFSGSATRSVSLAFNPKYVGGSGPTYSATAVTDIISFFTADAGTTTYVSVVGQGFA